MAEVPDSEKTYTAQLVLLAMGFLGPEDYVAQQLELEKDARTNYKTKGKQLRLKIKCSFVECPFKFLNQQKISGLNYG